MPEVIFDPELESTLKESEIIEEPELTELINEASPGAKAYLYHYYINRKIPVTRGVIKILTESGIWQSRQQNN